MPLFGAQRKLPDLLRVVSLVDLVNELLQLVVFLGVSPGFHALYEFIVFVDLGLSGR
jgi:hypothetical protein